MTLTYLVALPNQRQVQVSCSSAAITSHGDLVFNDAGAMQYAIAAGAWLRVALSGSQAHEHLALDSEKGQQG